MIVRRDGSVIRKDFIHILYWGATLYHYYRAFLQRRRCAAAAGAVRKASAVNYAVLPKESASARRPGMGCLQTATLEKATGDCQGQQLSPEQSQTKDSHRPDTTASLTGTSLCTYAVEPPCTERYARWCERSGLSSPSYSIEDCSFSLRWLVPNPFR